MVINNETKALQTYKTIGDARNHADILRKETGIPFMPANMGEEIGYILVKLG